VGKVVDSEECFAKLAQCSNLHFRQLGFRGGMLEAMEFLA